MKRMLWIALVLVALPLALVGCQQLRLSPSATLQSTPDRTVRVATWNVHYIITFREEGRWGMSGWAARRGPMNATFKAMAPDIIAFQEMESFAGGSWSNINLAREYLLAENPSYAAAATGDAQSFPSTQPIFYRRDRFTLRDEGWFHFSETPDIAYSRGFDGASPSFASWAVFETDYGQFRVVNIHPDAFSRVNRQASHALISERIAPWLAAGERVVLLGDFNALHGSRFHRQYQAQGLTFPKVSGATFHLDRGLHLLGAIDHIGVGTGIAPGKPVVFNRKLGEVWPSDHHPVLLDFELR